jgi:hypothetical protein
LERFSRKVTSSRKFRVRPKYLGRTRGFLQEEEKGEEVMMMMMALDMALMVSFMLMFGDVVPPLVADVASGVVADRHAMRRGRWRWRWR